ILHFSDLATNALNKGVRFKDIQQIKSKDRIADSKFTKDYKKLLEDIQKQMNTEFDRLIK
ncbi:MAG: hypothetical protein N3D84_01540, partial [Candidatus Woesearchaeota archaeon]|nr:hypothetical protein [Candidatus Woesearchaeota archaeon]